MGIINWTFIFEDDQYALCEGASGVIIPESFAGIELTRWDTTTGTPLGMQVRLSLHQRNGQKLQIGDTCLLKLMLGPRNTCHYRLFISNIYRKNQLDCLTLQEDSALFVSDQLYPYSLAESEIPFSNNAHADNYCFPVCFDAATVPCRLFVINCDDVPVFDLDDNQIQGINDFYILGEWPLDVCQVSNFNVFRIKHSSFGEYDVTYKHRLYKIHVGDKIYAGVRFDINGGNPIVQNGTLFDDIHILFSRNDRMYHETIGAPFHRPGTILYDILSDAGMSVDFSSFQQAAQDRTDFRLNGAIYRQSPLKDILCDILNQSRYNMLWNALHAYCLSKDTVPLDQGLVRFDPFSSNGIQIDFDYGLPGSDDGGAYSYPKGIEDITQMVRGVFGMQPSNEILTLPFIHDPDEALEAATLYYTLKKGLTSQADISYSSLEPLLCPGTIIDAGEVSGLIDTLSVSRTGDVRYNVNIRNTVL